MEIVEAPTEDISYFLSRNMHRYFPRDGDKQTLRRWICRQQVFNPNFVTDKCNAVSLILKIITEETEPYNTILFYLFTLIYQLIHSSLANAHF